MRGTGGIVAIYACQPNEVTYERELPPRSRDAKVYGLLTYTLCTVLTEANEKSSVPLTYNELARRVHGKYVQWGRVAPTPLIEGVDRDRQVLGDKIWAGRSPITLEADDDGLTINAGALHGLTTGSVLAVKSPSGGHTLLGHVRITDLGVHRSAVVPCSYGNVRLEAALPTGGVCAVVSIDLGEQRLRVAVDSRDADNQPLDLAKLNRLQTMVREMEGPRSLILPVAQPKDADWLVRMQGEQAVLMPGASWSLSHAQLRDPAFGPAPVDKGFGDWLTDRLNRIARAESLKKLAASSHDAASGGRVSVDLKITRKKDKLDKLGSLPTAWPAPQLTSHDRDRFVVKFHNKGRSAVDVTALYIDSGCGITCFYPRDGDLNRLRPGDADSFSLVINGKTTGMEHLVIIAVKATGQPVDFSALEQPTLERALEKSRSRGGELALTLETPLGRLLKNGMFGAGSSRAASTEELEDHAMTIVSFDVKSTLRP